MYCGQDFTLNMIKRGEKKYIGYEQASLLTTGERFWVLDSFLAHNIVHDPSANS
jgi:hypothetical protein